MSMQKMSFDLDKFPHLLNLKNTIEDMKRYIDLLNKRKVLLKEKNTEKTEYEKNEDEIVVIRTNWELAKAHKNLREKENYFTEFCEKLDEHIQEANDHYDEVVAKARAWKGNKTIAEQLRVEFDTVQKEDLNTDWQMRIKHFITLKAIMNPKPKTNK